jgi:hypothetical protein
MKHPLVRNPGIVVLSTNIYRDTQGATDGTAAIATKEHNNVTGTIYSWLSLEKNETVYIEPLKGVSQLT